MSRVRLQIARPLLNPVHDLFAIARIHNETIRLRINPIDQDIIENPASVVADETVANLSVDQVVNATRQQMFQQSGRIRTLKG